MWSIIGGTGFENFSDITILEKLNRDTPFGQCSSGLYRVKLYGQEALFLSRHGAHHELLPHEINYRANIFALKRYGASKILSISAVGSLTEEYQPGHLVIPDQYINHTHQPRQHTFCGDGIVAHTSAAKPVSTELVTKLHEFTQELDFTTHFGATYVCIDGPTFSTQAESLMYRSFNAQLIGMTNFPEYTLAREAGLAYLPACFVCDYDSWDPNIPHVTMAMCQQIMKENKQKAYALIKLVLSAMTQVLPNGCIEEGLQSGLMTPWEHIPEEKREWLSLLINR